MATTEGTEIPVSITYTGETMQRKDVVEYLQQVCTYHIAFDEFSEQYERLEKELETVKQKYDSSQWKAPNKTPPSRGLIGPIVWSAGAVLLGRWLLGLPFGLVFKAIVVGVMAFLIWMFFSSNEDAYKKELAAWEQEKEAYAQRLKWLEDQKASYVDGKPKEVADAEQVLEDVGRTREFARIRTWHFDSQEVLPKELREWPIPAELYGYFESGRVNTLSEAINLFHAERHNQRMIELQEEMRMREEAMMMQQNLNAARLSEQIESAKNEIEMDNFIQSCFVQDRLDSIYREMRDQ